MITIFHIEHFVLSSAGSIKQANVTDSLNYVSAIFHNMNLNIYMLHLHMNLQYVYE